MSQLERKSTSRSENMARIRAKNTKPEILLRKALWANGFRYRLHLRIEGARPDLVFPSKKLAVFVDGCFWHGCPQHYVRPRTRSEFWANKLTENTERDRAQSMRLVESGWHVLRIWEHELQFELPAVVASIISNLDRPSSNLVGRSIVTSVLEIDSHHERWQIEQFLDDRVKSIEMRSRRPPKVAFTGAESA